MNLFYELTDTDFFLQIEIFYDIEPSVGHGSLLVNDMPCVKDMRVPLLDNIKLKTENAWITSVAIDGLVITHFLPVDQSPNSLIQIPGPFYQWWHQISGQGWLVIPPALPE